MRLRDGTESETVPGQPDQYTVSTFAQTDLPLEPGSQEDVRLGRSDTPILAMSNRELLDRTHGKNGRTYQIEFQKRLAYPAACLVLMLVGVPLGISSRRGGKGAGFVLTIALVFIYYFLSSTGTALARQNKIPAFLGVWQANLLFALCGLVLLRQMATGGAALSALTSLGNWFRLRAEESTASAAPIRLTARKRATRGRFPLILDEYVLREFFMTFVMVLVTFVMLMLIFTFFELLSDIIKNRTPLVTVGEYLINLTPSMIYLITPLSVLIGVLVVFGIMNRNSELTAMKATGISLYRITRARRRHRRGALRLSLYVRRAVPAPGQSPAGGAAQRHQRQTRRNLRASRPQVDLRPAASRHAPAASFTTSTSTPTRTPSAIFPSSSSTPASFTIARRIFASTAHWEPNLDTWVFEDGWERTFNGPERYLSRLSPSKRFPKSPSSPLTSRKKCASLRR